MLISIQGRYKTKNMHEKPLATVQEEIDGSTAASQEALAPVQESQDTLQRMQSMHAEGRYANGEIIPEDKLKMLEEAIAQEAFNALQLEDMPQAGLAFRRDDITNEKPLAEVHEEMDDFTAARREAWDTVIRDDAAIQESNELVANMTSMYAKGRYPNGEIIPSYKKARLQEAIDLEIMKGRQLGVMRDRDMSSSATDIKRADENAELHYKKNQGAYQDAAIAEDLARTKAKRTGDEIKTQR
jgi:hypothetical protein